MRKFSVLGSFCSLLLLLVGCGSQAATLTPTVTATQSPAATTGPTTTPSPWQTYTDPKYGYRIDLPTLAVYSSVDRTWEYIDPQSHANVGITFDGGFQPDFSFCSTGTRITVGNTIAGRQIYIDPRLVTPAPGAQPMNDSIILANFVAEGIYIEVTFQITPAINQQQFFTEYGAAWQHMLASFQPGTGSFGSAQPCS